LIIFYSILDNNDSRNSSSTALCQEKLSTDDTQNLVKISLLPKEGQAVPATKVRRSRFDKDPAPVTTEKSSVENDLPPPVVVRKLYLKSNHTKNLKKKIQLFR
jgi:hypothetical protein